MSIGIETGYVKYYWLRRVSRSLFVAAVLSRLLYTAFFFLVIKQVGPAYWDFGFWGFVIPVVIASAIAWFAPIAGGICALVWIPLAWIFLGFVSFATQSIVRDTALIPESIFLVAGGILSIIWGAIRRKKNG